MDTEGLPLRRARRELEGVGVTSLRAADPEDRRGGRGGVANSEDTEAWRVRLRPLVLIGAAGEENVLPIGEE